MVSCLNKGFLLWAYIWFVQKESFLVFTSRSVVGYETSNSCSENIWVSYILELGSLFDIGGGYGFIIIVKV